MNKNIYNKLFDRFLNLWFFPSDPVRLEIFQKVFAFTFLMYTFAWFQYAFDWLSPYGFHLTPATKDWYNTNPFPLIPMHLVPQFGMVMFGSTIAVILGWHSRIFIWLVLACAIYIQDVDIISSYTLNKLYIVVFFILALAPRPIKFSGKSSGKSVYKQSSWPIRIIQITLLIQYCVAGLCKVIHGDWDTNPDVLWTFTQGHYCTELCAGMLRVTPKIMWTAMMYISLFFEILAPLLFGIKKLRWIAISIGLIFQIMVALTMHQLIYFSAQIMSFYILFIDEKQLIVFKSKCKGLASRFLKERSSLNR